MSDIHSCSYYCTRPECVLQQRDELRDKLMKQQAEPVHADDAMAIKFCEAMQEKLAKQRAKGYGGWETCDPNFLRDQLATHVGKGDPVDVANFCAMLWSRGESTAQQAEPVAWLRVIDEAMVTHHLGVADPTDDYETAKRKMNTLLCMAQDIGADFAKQAEPVQEPVGALLVNRESREGVMFYSVDMIPDPATLKDRFELVKVYTAPQQRKPLTVEEIVRIIDDNLEGGSSLVDIARAIEAAHGIKEKA